MTSFGAIAYFPGSLDWFGRRELALIKHETGKAFSPDSSLEPPAPQIESSHPSIVIGR